MNLVNSPSSAGLDPLAWLVGVRAVALSLVDAVAEAVGQFVVRARLGRPPTRKSEKAVNSEHLPLWFAGTGGASPISS